MAVSFDRIDRLTSERNNWCIAVKVVKTWQAYEADGLECFNFLLSDAEVCPNIFRWESSMNDMKIYIY